MKVLEYIFAWLFVAFIVFTPISWVWVIYHKIKCFKVNSCTDRKCKYWNLCNHNCEERKKDEFEERKQRLMRKGGLSEDDLN